MIESKKALFSLLARSTLRIVLAVVVVIALLILVGWMVMIRMPGDYYDGELPKLSSAQESLKDDLERDVRALSVDIGTRNLASYKTLVQSVGLIESSFSQAGYQVQKQEYNVHDKTCTNLIVELPGLDKADEIVVVGTHYDTDWGTPGADDNASAVASLLALGRALKGKSFSRTLRLVAFVNEEPPFFQTEQMGSLVYARECKKQGDNIVAALVLEMLGFYSDEENSQKYPSPFSWFYPSVGNFIAFVGNIDSRALVHQVVESFRRQVKFPSVGVAAFNAIPGVGFSDHWSFWQIDVPAVMVTDTAFFRNPNYHEKTDTADTLDYDKMARVVSGLELVIVELLNQ
jgi:hypothetical protein